MWSLRCINPASLSQKHANYGHSWLTTSQILNTTPKVGHLLTTRHPVCPQILDSVVVFFLGFFTTTAPGYKHPISDVTPCRKRYLADAFPGLSKPGMDRRNEENHFSNLQRDFQDKNRIQDLFKALEYIFGIQDFFPIFPDRGNPATTWTCFNTSWGTGNTSAVN